MNPNTSGDTLLKSCDPVHTLEEAKRPIVTPLLPVKGLRRDASGNLTEDAIQTIKDGMKSLGVSTETESSRDAILQEARQSLCRIYAQYQFLLDSFATMVSRSEKVSQDMVDLLRQRLQQMADILSFTRYTIGISHAEDAKEGFQNFAAKATARKELREAFQAATEEVSTAQSRLANGSLFQLRQRALETTEEKNRFASRQLSFYAFMNVVAVGLLFYIASV